MTARPRPLKCRELLLSRIAREPIATGGVAWSICLCVCLLMTFVSPVKTAEPIEMLMRGRVNVSGLKKPCIRLGSSSSTGRGNFGGCPAH